MANRLLGMVTAKGLDLLAVVYDVDPLTGQGVCILEVMGTPAYLRQLPSQLRSIVEVLDLQVTPLASWSPMVSDRASVPQEPALSAGRSRGPSAR